MDSAAPRVVTRYPKSSRHSKLTGDFGEALVLYWLSRHGYECALVDHTGIDIIARAPDGNTVMGISVKSRSRNPGTEKTGVSIHRADLAKAERACEAFRCVPYFAVVVDAANTIQVFLLAEARLLELYPRGGKTISWQMTERRIKEYREDPHVRHFAFTVSAGNWPT